MDRQEKIIADAAIATPKANRFERIQEEVALTTGIAKAEVTQTVNRLVNEMILRQRVTPARDVAENPHVPGESREITWAWYEKGELWKDG